MKKIKKKDLKELFEYIGGVYVGDYAAISRDLNRAVYYLHYLEKDVGPTTCKILVMRCINWPNASLGPQ